MIVSPLKSPSAGYRRAALESKHAPCDMGAMLNIVSIIFGLVALLLAVPTVVPFFGWVNWFILPIAGVGLVLGLMSDKKSGQYFCAVVMGLCALRLFIGGGWI
jgi:uncharacterized membrane protein